MSTCRVKPSTGGTTPLFGLFLASLVISNAIPAKLMGPDPRLHDRSAENGHPSRNDHPDRRSGREVDAHRAIGLTAGYLVPMPILTGFVKMADLSSPAL
jgi:hypothetical protein